MMSLKYWDVIPSSSRHGNRLFYFREIVRKKTQAPVIFIQGKLVLNSLNFDVYMFLICQCHNDGVRNCKTKILLNFKQKYPQEKVKVT